MRHKPVPLIATRRHQTLVPFEPRRTLTESIVITYAVLRTKRSI